MKQLCTLACLVMVLLPLPAQAIDNNVKLRFIPEVKDIKFILETDYRYHVNDLFYRHYDAGIRFPLKFLGEGWSAGIHLPFGLP